MNKLSRFPNFSRCRPVFWFYNAQPGISDSFELQMLLCHLLKFFSGFWYTASATFRSLQRSQQKHQKWFSCFLCYSYRACSYSHYIIHCLHSVIHHLWNTSTSACFGMGVPTSRSHYNKVI